MDVDDHVGTTLVQRLVDEVFNGQRLDVIDELYHPDLAPGARRWIGRFLTSFRDASMEVVTLVTEGDVVVGRFRCSGTHLATWRGHPPTGRAFRDIDEVTFFTITDGRIADAWSLEDTDARLRQLGLPAVVDTGPSRHERSSRSQS